MRRFAPILATFLVLPSAAPAHGDDDGTICDTGPITRIYGNAPWQVYSCRDRQSVLFVSTPTSDGTRGFFAFVPHNGKYKLHSESDEMEAMFSPAYEEIKLLTPEDIAELIAATEAQ